MSLYVLIKTEADKIFSPDRIECFKDEIEFRVSKRTDINSDLEKRLAYDSAYRDMKQEYITTLLEEKRIERMSEFISLYNSSDTNALHKAMFAAFCATHHTIQSDLLAGMLALIENVSTMSPNAFSSRNAHWKGISTRLIWAYYHPDLVDIAMGKNT